MRLDPVVVDAVEDLRGDADAADVDAGLLRLAGEQVLDRLVELADRRRRDRVERRQARDYLLDQFLRQVADQRVELLRLEIGEDHRHDLRVLELDHLGEDARVLPLDRLDAGEIVALAQPADETLGLLGAERPFQHAADIGFRTDADRGLLQHQVDEFLSRPR